MGVRLLRWSPNLRPSFGGRRPCLPARFPAATYRRVMEIGRRALLGLGAAAVLSTVTSCRDREVTTRPETIPLPSTPTPTPTALPAGQYPAQPAPGSMYYGASVPHNRSLSDWETELACTLALHRTFFTPDHNETDQLVARCRDDLAHDRMPHVSIKPTWTWADIASGNRNIWLDDLLRRLGELSEPVIFTLHHEPENDAGGPGMLPSDYVAMQQHLFQRAADLAPQVLATPVLQQWTFDPLHSDFDASQWLVPDAPAVGLDVYNPWSPTNGKEWRSFGSKMDEVLGWFDDTPILIGEYGCRRDPANPGLAAEWMRDAATYGRTHNFVSMSYFNSGVQSPDGTWALQGETEQAFAELVNQSWVARPA
jgi:hypothetical protein